MQIHAALPTLLLPIPANWNYDVTKARKLLKFLFSLSGPLDIQISKMKNEKGCSLFGSLLDLNGH